jgi:hypothetical protein
MYVLETLAEVARRARVTLHRRHLGGATPNPTTQNSTLTPRGKNFQSANVWGPGALQKSTSVGVGVNFRVVTILILTLRILALPASDFGDQNKNQPRLHVALQPLPKLARV